VFFSFTGALWEIHKTTKWCHLGIGGRRGRRGRRREVYCFGVFGDTRL